jgi:hypothetical protein
MDPIERSQLDVGDGFPWADLHRTVDEFGLVVAIDRLRGGRCSAVPVSPTGTAAGDIAIANLGRNAVSMINTITATIAVGVGPNDVAAKSHRPQADDIYVTDIFDGTVTVIS